MFTPIEGLKGMIKDETLWRKYFATPNIIIPSVESFVQSSSSRPGTQGTPALAAAAALMSEGESFDVGEVAENESGGRE
jgi:hypothetical protein